MGNTCNSCASTPVATAKLIFEDGRLEEFSYPVRVSQILQGNLSVLYAKQMTWSLTSMFQRSMKMNIFRWFWGRMLLVWDEEVDPAIEWNSKSPTDETSPMVATATHSHDGGGCVAERRGRSGGGRERKSTARLTPRLSAIMEE
ncbi:hypothetical protein IMY05_004G0106700 [Salix suchowensis]|nr:hypothetical protein IMY05_004G0106700 [Salix suchowensis]